MVGNIGGLRTPPAAPVDRAVEYALALISGWTDKKREPFKAALEDLRESAKHNAEVYEQASAALHELSTRGKEVRELAAAAKEAHEAALTLTRQVETEATEVRATLSAERATHRGQVEAFESMADARDRSVTVREDAASAYERKLVADEAALARRVKETESLAQKAGAVRDRYTAKEAALAVIINRKD